MEGFKEFFETFDARLRSPILGSSIVSFAAINWKALFYITFSSTPVTDKFTYFDEATDIFSLLVYPLLLGIVFVLISPWIKLFGANLVKKPTSMLKVLQANSIHDNLVLKQKLSADRKRLLASEETALIDQAKRDQQIQFEISNQKIREELQKEISELRSSLDSKSTKVNAEQIKKLEDKLSSFENRKDSPLSEGQDGNLSPETLEKIEIIRKRINRYRIELENENLTDTGASSVEERIITELDRIEAIKTGKQFSNFDLDDEIPF